MKNERKLNIDKVSMELDDMLEYIGLPELKNKTKFFDILNILDQLIRKDKENMNNNSNNNDNNINNKEEEDNFNLIHDNINNDSNNNNSNNTNNNSKNMQKLFSNIKSYKEMFSILTESHKSDIINEKCDKVLNPSLFGSCLPIIYSFINLPELAIDFEYSVYDIPCEVCKKTGKNSLVCLDCGKKVCDSRKCLKTKEGGVTVPGFIDHCLTCGGGRTAYLQTSDCSVLFVSHKAVFRKFIPLYVNKFGEAINKRRFGKEFVLCQEEVNKALNMFTKYSYSNAQIIT